MLFQKIKDVSKQVMKMQKCVIVYIAIIVSDIKNRVKVIY